MAPQGAAVLHATCRPCVGQACLPERLRFVARLLEGEKMAVLCREFDISRETGHKIFNRYKQTGLEGLTDRSRRRE
jgi:transposase